MFNLSIQPTYREAVATLAAELDALAALDVPLAVKAEHAALVWTVEQCGGIVDLLTGDIDWSELQRSTPAERAKENGNHGTV